MEIINRNANYNYDIEDTYECGVALTGTEIKSIKSGKANIKDSYAIIKNDEVFLLNMHVSHYKEGNLFNHEEKRTRKLLLHKSQIKSLKKQIEQQGYTLVPLKLYFKGPLLKVLIGLAKGKHNYDKRETIKKRDLEREIRRGLKNN